MLAALLSCALVGLLSTSTAAGAVTASLPASSWGRFLPAVSAPVLTPGNSGDVAVELANPLNLTLQTPALSLRIYAFNPTTGSGSGALPAGGAPSLGNPPDGALEANLTLPSLAPGASVNFSVGIAIPSSAPDGIYAIRIALQFGAGGQNYLLESRGFFSATQWAQATQSANGTPTLNATRLGVSGVIAETSVLVQNPALAWALYAVLGVGLALAALGAYFWSRPGPGPSSGARRGSPPQSAPSTLGKRRSRDGD